MRENLSTTYDIKQKDHSKMHNGPWVLNKHYKKHDYENKF